MALVCGQDAITPIYIYVAKVVCFINVQNPTHRAFNPEGLNQRTKLVNWGSIFIFIDILLHFLQSIIMQEFLRYF